MDRSRKVSEEDVFSSAPSAHPSTLSHILCQMGAEITPTESDVTQSNYSEGMNKDVEEEAEEDDQDFIGDVESDEPRPANHSKTKRGKYPHILREVSRHEGDCHFNAIEAISVWWNVPVATVCRLALVSPLQTRDAGNTWNTFQTWHRLVDPVRPGESGKLNDLLIKTSTKSATSQLRIMLHV